MTGENPEKELKELEDKLNEPKTVQNEKVEEMKKSEETPVEETIEETAAEENAEVAEAIEKKEEETEQPKEETVNADGEKKIPWMFVGLLLVFGILLVFTLQGMNFQPTQTNTMNTLPTDQNIADQNNEPIVLHLKEVYSVEFNRMNPKKNSMFFVFDQWNVDYEIEKINLDLNEFDGFEKDQEITVLSTVMIEEKELNELKKQRPDMESLIERIKTVFTLNKNNYYLADETYADEKYSLKFFLESPLGECATESKYKVHLFEDPYDGTSISIVNRLKITKNKFPGLIDYQYVYMPRHSLELYEKHGKEQVDLGGLFMLAAQNQEKFDKFREQFYLGYCDKDNSGTLDNMEEMVNCLVDNNRADNPFTKEELLAIAEKAGMDLNAAELFLENSSAVLEEQKSIYAALKIPLSPYVAVDCKATIYNKSLDVLLCEFDSTMEGCKP